jgi:uracil-DNA glycosylase
MEDQVIHYKDCSISDYIESPDDNTCIFCFPAISLKNFSELDDSYIKVLYHKYGEANYYKQNAMGSRAKKGTISKFKSDNGVTIINLFFKQYPSNKNSYIGDNNVVRIKYLKQCLNLIAEKIVLTDIHMQFPVNDICDFKEYDNIIKDFISTYQLKNDFMPVVTIYKNGIDGTVAPSNYKLVIDNPSLIVKQKIFEFEFTTVSDEPPTMEQQGIMSYFPTENRWLSIYNDPKINSISRNIDKYLDSETEPIYPPFPEVFNAFKYLKTDPKVIILGQDPYHGPNQANGLSFSVKLGIKPPPSLKNIYKAIDNDQNLKMPFEIPDHGCLESWAEQGVLLLNTALTVRHKKAKSHSEIWAPFTDRVIELISSSHTKLVFMLWGGLAKSKKKLISKTNHHLVLEYCHPSPMVRNNTFPTQCDHFSKANDYLVSVKKEPINWSLPSREKILSQ